MDAAGAEGALPSVDSAAGTSKDEPVFFQAMPALKHLIPVANRPCEFL